jgi:hypothetical protein
MLCTGLPCPQHHHMQESLPTPIDWQLNPLPQGCAPFTKLNMHWGYNNVHIWEGNEWKAAFHTNQGFFELVVMYFGLTNSLATF